jgi:prepilin-type N-terminal cleavage/methylation domain-containing protein
MQRALRQRRGTQAGLTLIELLAAMVILAIVGTMLVMSWISLQSTYAFTERTNTARGTARDAIDRISSEVRDAQPPTSSSTTPFVLTLASPYVCDANDCVFYSAYNNPAAQPDGTGIAQLRLTAIWLDTSGSAAQKTLYWQRDTNNNGAFDAGDRKFVLATNVVNTVASVNRPIFTYTFRDTNGNYTTANSLTSTNVGTLVSVQIELVVDANLAHRPKYVDLMTTVRPRNVGS